jgi:NAD(P)-dependent dehydrogenase (short-subunit alcohol dehydrogenase family)
MISKNQNARHVLITGGLSGIGLEMARRFIAEGDRVAVLDRHLKSLEEARALLPGLDLYLQADVRIHGEIQSAFETLRFKWDGLDVLLNNAGVSQRETCLEVTPDSWDFTMSVNLKGAFFVAQEAARLMQRNLRGGVILHTASVSGMVGMPNYVTYNASKAALIEIAKTMALELAPRIRVNCICPGYILTPMQAAEYTNEQIRSCAEGLPLQRLGKPEEVAELALFLASDKAAFATGQSYVLDGGETAGGLASR